MNKRLEQFLAAENISQAPFADEIHVARASVSHILAGRNKPSYDFITGMLEQFPRLNPEWLLTGRGKMYKDPLVAEKPDRAPLPVPDLFSAPEPDPVVDEPEADNPPRIPDSPASPAVAAESSLQKEDTASPKPAQTVDSQRKIVKILVFYDDQTYTEIF